MEKIRFVEQGNRTKVFLNQKHVGTIRMVMGYSYFPKGKDSGGGIFKTERECMESLEND